MEKKVLPSFANLIVASMYAPDFPPGHVCMFPSAPFIGIAGNTLPLEDTTHRVMPLAPKMNAVDSVVVDTRLQGHEMLGSALLARGWTVIPSMEGAMRQIQGHHIWASDGVRTSVVLDVTNEDPSEDGWLWSILMSRFGGQHIAGDTLIVGKVPLWLRSLVHAEETGGHQVLFEDALEALAATYRLAA